MFGFAMLTLAVGSLQLMLDRGQLKDWFYSSEIGSRQRLRSCASTR
jgi:DHA2 family multidrug resistance protein